MRVWDMRLLQDDLPVEKEHTELIYEYIDSEKNRRQIDQRFTKLQRRLIVGLILGFLVPNILLAAYFHLQLTQTLQQGVNQGLESVADNQKNVLNLFLRERVGNLYNLLLNPGFSLSPSQKDMEEYLHSLTLFQDDFIDVGLLNPQGVQIGYAGPSPELQGKSYRDESWWQLLLHGDTDHIIGDIRPEKTGAQYVVAVRYTENNQSYVLRAGLDPTKIHALLRAATDNRVNSFLVNSHGQYQASATDTTAQTSPFIPPAIPRAGLQEQEIDEIRTLVAYTWLNEAPWALLVTQEWSVARANLHQMQLILALSVASISLIFSLLIFFTIRKLMIDARRMAEKGNQLQEMLAHASKLASIGELAAGVAHEINNPLAIIMATSGVIRDMFNPEFELDNSPEALFKELEVIDNAATRAKGITKKLQEMGKTRMPQTEPCDINAQVETVLNRLKGVEFKNKAIDVHLELASDLPPVLADPEPLRQVFHNILLNAADAIGERGGISIRTGLENNMVAITIADTGRGIAPENLERIFHPFFTTKGGGHSTGLGLSIAASIVKYLGGVIKVSSVIGKGSTFTVLLPNNFCCPLNQ